MHKHILSTQKNLRLLGYACGIGSEHKQSREGPEYLKNYMVDIDNLYQFIWDKIIKHDEQHNMLHSFSAYSVIKSMTLELAERVNKIINNEMIPIVIGGDHSSAIGTWSGVSSTIKNKQNLGIIWFDAHLDSHTPETSPSGYYHGMPVAALLGHGDKELCRTYCSNFPKIDSDSIAIIGARNYEQEELDFILSQNVRLYQMEEVLERGVSVILNEVVGDVLSHCDHLGVSLDIDAIDPCDAPGVGTGVKNGIRKNELFNALFNELPLEKLICFEIAELNPAFDCNSRTAQLICELLHGLFVAKGVVYA